MSQQEHTDDITGPAGQHELLNVAHLGRASYAPVLSYQKDLHQKRLDGEVPDTLIFVEHDPVYTLGKAADPEHITASNQFLTDEDIDVVDIDRGGDVTYHGPGQIVGYPIFDLREHKRSVSWYMRTLEQAIMNALDTYGIDTRRREGEPGVWVGDEKICAVGVRIARWITYHGFALNLDPDMRHFGGIVPCGIQDGGVVSMSDLLSSPSSRSDVCEQVTTTFQNMFGFQKVRHEDVTLDQE